MVRKVQKFVFLCLCFSLAYFLEADSVVRQVKAEVKPLIKTYEARVLHDGEILDSFFWDVEWCFSAYRERAVAVLLACKYWLNKIEQIETNKVDALFHISLALEEIESFDLSQGYTKAHKKLTEKIYKIREQLRQTQETSDSPEQSPFLDEPLLKDDRNRPRAVTIPF